MKTSNILSFCVVAGLSLLLSLSTSHASKTPSGELASLVEQGLAIQQAWSFYLEKLMEDEGYYETFPYMEMLKTKMARLQMRMWRVQRILTKCKMAKDEMTFEEAVQAYIDKIGMEPANSFIEVQRDSQSPSPPGREIIGERVILELREEYKQRMGEHYQLKNFNDNLLVYGDLPFEQIRKLMFN
jgi:uncharacterized protein (DUF885 family)